MLLPKFMPRIDAKNAVDFQMTKQSPKHLCECNKRICIKNCCTQQWVNFCNEQKSLDLEKHSKLRDMNLSEASKIHKMKYVYRVFTP